MDSKESLNYYKKNINDPKYHGFVEVKDKYRYLPRICFTVFIISFIFLIWHGFWSPKYQIKNIGIYFLILMFCCIVIGGTSVHFPRKCEKCKRKMKRITPEEYDNVTTYKYYCPYCKTYVETQINISSSDD